MGGETGIWFSGVFCGFITMYFIVQFAEFYKARKVLKEYRRARLECDALSAKVRSYIAGNEDH